MIIGFIDLVGSMISFAGFKDFEYFIDLRSRSVSFNEIEFIIMIIVIIMTEIISCVDCWGRVFKSWCSGLYFSIGFPYFRRAIAVSAKVFIDFCTTAVITIVTTAVIIIAVTAIVKGLTVG